MRLLRTALVMTVALGSTACFQSSTLLKIKADGSGTIEERMLFTAAAIEQMKQLAGVTGADAANFDPLSEDSARQMAGSLGNGVRFVSSTPVKTADGEGRNMLFAFDDIRTLKVSQQPPGAPAAGASDAADARKFTLTRSGATSTLKIGMPNVGSLGDAAGLGGGAGTAPPAAQLAMLKTLLAGARITIGVEPAGKLIRTSSPYVEGNRVTLVDLPIDALFADPTLFTKLQAAPNPAAAAALLQNVPGLKVPAQTEVTIEFQP